LRKLKDFPVEYPHQHKTNASSKSPPPFQEGAEAEIETASTPTSKGTSPSTQEASPTWGRFLFYKYLKSLGKMSSKKYQTILEAYNSIYEVASAPDPKLADKKPVNPKSDEIAKSLFANQSTIAAAPPPTSSEKPVVKPETPPPTTSSEKPVVKPQTTPPPVVPAAPQKTFQQELDDLRKASAQASMAGPSREAQALMAQTAQGRRALARMGPEKLKAGIEGQERVERMKNEIGKPKIEAPKPQASTPTSTPAAKTGAGIVLAKKDGISGTLNKSTGQFTAGTFDKDQEARYTQRRGAEQLKIDADKVLAKNTNPETRQPQPPPPKEPTSGLTDAEKKRIDDFRALGTLQKLQKRGEMEKELEKLTPEKRKEVLDYYNRKESFDLFDYLLEYLVAEGYADTNKAALVIMANMSEEWKQSIVEGGFPGTPSTLRAGDAGTSGLKMIQTGGTTGYINKHSGGNVLPTGTVKKIMSGDLMVKDIKKNTNSNLA